MAKAKIDYLELRNFLTGEPNDLDAIDEWHQKLLKVEIDDSESAENVKLLLQAFKWILQYEHTNAQEIRDLAVKEAANAAEIEEKLKEENNALKYELNNLRESITSNAEASDLNEMLRAEIENSREENTYLNNQIREKEREAVLQRDKVEELQSRLEQLEKERIEIINQQSHMEDVIQEMNRRLESENEAAVKSEAKARKLKRRSEQAAKLSLQLQEIAKQNDTLTAEVERLSTALSSATQFIGDTGVKYQQLRDELVASNKFNEELLAENESITKELAKEKAVIEKLQSTGQQSAEQFKEIVNEKNIQIEDFRKKLHELQIEIEQRKARYELENTEAKEEELERLRIELVNATKQAKELFGSYSAVSDDFDNKRQAEIVHLNNDIKSLEKQLQERDEENLSLRESNEKKDAENARIRAELTEIKKRIFGSAETEINRLEKQLKYRDEQIEKLTSKCSLLQIEFANITESKPSFKTTDKNKVKDQENKIKCETVSKTELRSLGTVTDATVPQETTSEPEKEQKIVDINSLEANAMLIASLNNELMQILQELKDKEMQIQKTDTLLEKTTKEVEQLKQKFMVLSKTEETKNEERCNEQNNDKLAEMEIAITEYKKFMDTIRENGSDLERRIEATHRNLIAEKISCSRLERKIQVIEKLRDEEKRKYEKLKGKCYEDQVLFNKQQLVTRYETDLMTIEMARLQNIILHSVPQDEYNKIVNLVKRLLKKSLVPDSHFTEEAELESDDTLGLKLLMKHGDEKPMEEELIAKIEYLQNLVTMLTNQNEFWQNENATLRSENEEVKKLLEDLETESQLASLVASIERRFLDALKEQKLCMQNKTANPTIFAFDPEFANRKRWNNERKKLISIIRSLKIRIQTDATNKFQGITLQEMFDLQKKMKEIAETEKIKQAELAQIRKEKDEIGAELLNIKSEKSSFEEITKNNNDMIKIQKSLQAAFLTVSTLTREVETLKSAVRKKEELIEELEKQNQDLNTKILDLITESNIIDEIEQHGSLINEVSTVLPDTSSSLEEKEEEKTESSETINKKLQLHYPESVKTVIYDNWDECQKQINKIKNTAEICINNYKAQLLNKEKAIERYKSLLENYEKMNTPKETTEKVDNITQVKKFRKSDEILGSSELQEVKCELVKARNKIDELEKLNELLSEETVELSHPFPTTERGIQTESSCLSSPNLENANAATLSQETEDDDDETFFIGSETSHCEEKNLKLPNDRTIETRDQERFVEQKRAQAEIALLKTQNRHFVQRIKQLSFRNKEMERLCEELRNDTVASIEKKFNQNDDFLANSEILRLNEEVEELKKKISRQMKTIKQQKETIESMKDKSKTTNSKTTEEEVAHWSEKKSFQKTILGLRKKIELLEKSNNEFKRKLERCENSKNSLYKERESYLKNQKILQQTIEKLKEENNALKAKEDLLEDKMSAAEATLRTVNERLRVAEDIEGKLNEVLKELKETENNYCSLMNDYTSLKEKYESRLNNDENYAVIAVLSDKLRFKEKVIEKLQERITVLEDEKWRREF